MHNRRHKFTARRACFRSRLRHQRASSLGFGPPPIRIAGISKKAPTGKRAGLISGWCLARSGQFQTASAGIFSVSPDLTVSQTRSRLFQIPRNVCNQRKLADSALSDARNLDQIGETDFLRLSANKLRACECRRLVAGQSIAVGNNVIGGVRASSFRRQSVCAAIAIGNRTDFKLRPSCVCRIHAVDAITVGHDPDFKLRPSCVCRIRAVDTITVGHGSNFKLRASRKHALT